VRSRSDVAATHLSVHSYRCLFTGAYLEDSFAILHPRDVLPETLILPIPKNHLRSLLHLGDLMDISVVSINYPTLRAKQIGILTEYILPAVQSIHRVANIDAALLQRQYLHLWEPSWAQCL
jgi:hypothetical protein